MVRLRPAAAAAVTSSAPSRVRQLLCGLLLTALVIAAGCSAAARSEPSNLGDEPASPSTLESPVAATSTMAQSALEAAELAVETAWANSKVAFYEAALSDDPQYEPLLATLVRGGPVYVHSIAYLSALASAGVRGPPTWRVGHEHVVGIEARRARVEGCLFDTGSRWKATGASAPASLGGGAGLTASDATLELVGGKWLVLTDQVSVVSSPKEPGPCRGF